MAGAGQILRRSKAPLSGARVIRRQQDSPGLESVVVRVNGHLRGTYQRWRKGAVRAYRHAVPYPFRPQLRPLPQFVGTTWPACGPAMQATVDKFVLGQ